MPEITTNNAIKLYYGTVGSYTYTIPSGASSTATFKLSVRKYLDWGLQSMCDAVGVKSGSTVTFQIDTFTQEFQRVCKQLDKAWLEIYDDSTGNKVVYLQRIVHIGSRAGTISGNPPAPVSQYYTKNEADTSFVKQVSTMPEASSALNGRVYMFVGTTTTSFTKGSLYLCEEVSSVYTWVNVTQSSGGKNAYLNIKQIRDYLFDVQYSPSVVNYANAVTYYETNPDNETVTTGGGCSGVYHNGKVLRHLDWYYDKEAEFIVRIEASEDKGTHKSIGVAAGMPYMEKDFVESGAYSGKYLLVPFSMSDGVNDAGVYVQTNVTPKKTGNINIPHTSSEYLGKLSTNMIPRAILDYCSSVNDVQSVLNKFDIFRSPRMPAEYDSHFLVADSSGNHGIIEFADNGLSYQVIKNADDKDIITNFSVDHGITQDTLELDWNTINTYCPYGVGLERWEKVLDRFEEIESSETVDFEQLREDLKYTNAYAYNTTWLTEFAGTVSAGHKLTVIDARENPGLYAPVISAEHDKYVDRTRSDAKSVATWHTVHSTIYDIANKSMEICIQERLTDKIIVSMNATTVQPDWNQTNTSAADYIKNKPTIPSLADCATKTWVTQQGYLTQHQSLTGYQTKLSTDNKLPYTYISGTPTIPTITNTYSASSSNGMSGVAVASAISTKANASTTIQGYGITDAYTKTEIDSKLSSVYTYKGSVSNYSDLPASGNKTGDTYNITNADTEHGVKAGDNVAWTGSAWDVLAGTVDLSGYQTKITVSNKLPYSLVSDTPALATVATTGSYTDLDNKPSIPSLSGYATETWVEGKGYLTQHQSLTGYQTLITASNKLSYSLIDGAPSLATVATSGSYTDLDNKPSIPTITDTYSSSSSNGMSGIAVASAISGKANSSDIKNSTITFTQGGTTKGSFTLNQSSNATIALDAGGGGGGSGGLSENGDVLDIRNSDSISNLPAKSGVIYVVDMVMEPDGSYIGFQTPESGYAPKFEVWLKKTSSMHEIDWTSSGVVIAWDDGTGSYSTSNTPPDISTVNMCYHLVFQYDPVMTRWNGNLAAKVALA